MIKCANCSQEKCDHTPLQRAPLDELSAEIRARGWRMIPDIYARAFAGLAGGLSNGWWPALEVDAGVGQLDQPTKG